MLKRSDLEKALGSSVSSVARDLVLRSNAQARHDARVAETRATALTAAGGSVLLAWALCALDENGIGGRCGAGLDGGSGCSTSRHPAFSGLGKGRRQATDGAAWMAALSQARESFENELGAVPRLVARNGYLVAELGDESCIVTGCAWVEAWARSELIRLGRTEAIDAAWVEEVQAWAELVPEPEPEPENPNLENLENEEK